MSNSAPCAPSNSIRLPGFDRIEQIGRRVGHVRSQPLGISRGIRRRSWPASSARCPAVADKQASSCVLGADDLLDPLAEIVAIQIAQPHG